MDACRTCGDLYMEMALKKSGVSTSRYRSYPCIHIAYHAEDEDHSLMVDRRNIGITIPDSQGGGYLKIDFCPWCGKTLGGFRGLRRQQKKSRRSAR